MTTTQPQQRARTNNVRMQQMLRAATKKVKVARKMVNEGGRWQGQWRRQLGWRAMKRVMATAMREMAARVVGE